MGGSKGKKKLDLSAYSPAQLGKYMQKLFKIADKDGNGTLDRQELTELLGWSGFEFAVKDIEDLMAKADKNKDGVIEYGEFVVLMKGFCNIDDSLEHEVVSGVSVDVQC